MLITVYLATNASAATPAYMWPGGEGVFLAEFTGGSISLQYQGPNPNTDVWYDVGTDTTLAASGGGAFLLPPATPIRVNVTGATGVYATVMRDE